MGIRLCKGLSIKDSLSVREGKSFQATCTLITKKKTAISYRTSTCFPFMLSGVKQLFPGILEHNRKPLYAIHVNCKLNPQNLFKSSEMFS